MTKYCVRGLRAKRAVKKLGYNYKFDQTSIPYNSYRCLLCFETQSNLGKKEECRRCGKPMCGHCFMQHMCSTIERAKRYGTYPQLECPFCRLKPWFKPPDFTVRYRGVIGDTLPSVTIYFDVQGESEKVTLQAIHDDHGLCGYVSLYHAPEDASYHVRDLQALEKWSCPLKALRSALCKAPGSVIFYSGHDQEGFFCHLEDIGVGYKREPNNFFAVECFEDAIGSKLFE